MYLLEDKGKGLEPRERIVPDQTQDPADKGVLLGLSRLRWQRRLDERIEGNLERCGQAQQRIQGGLATPPFQMRNEVRAEVHSFSELLLGEAHVPACSLDGCPDAPAEGRDCRSLEC